MRHVHTIKRFGNGCKQFRKLFGSALNVSREICLNLTHTTQSGQVAENMQILNQTILLIYI